MQNNSGITMIALAITMIIMIILATISVTVLSGDNSLIKKAEEAKQDTDVKQEEDIIKKAVYQAMNNNRYGELDKTELENALNSIARKDINSVESFEDGIQIDFKSGRGYVVKTDDGKIAEPIVRTEIEIGSYVDYEPDVPNTTVYPHTTLDTYSGSTENTADIVQDNLNWQVLRKYADGSMDLIGSVTSQSIYFTGILGYTNGVYLMDEICKTLYSRNANNITARSVDLEDFEYWLKQSTEGTATRDNYKSSSGYSYGDTETYSSNNKYPPFYKTQTSESDPGSLTTNSSYATDGDLTAKHTYYNIIFDNKNLSDGYKALSSSKIYWLGSRCTFLNSTDVSFSLQRSHTASRYMFFNSDGSSYYGNQCLRPVVHLKSSVQITANAGTESEKHHIESY